MKFDKTTDLKAIPTLPSGGKSDEIIFDETLPGFGLRIRDSGNRSWVLQVRIRGRSRRFTLGTFERFKPAVARQAAEKLFAEVLLGGDPAAKEEAARREQSHTMLATAKLFLDAREGELRETTAKELRRYLTGAAYFTALHRAPLATIARKDISAAIARIANANGRVTAVRARAAISSLFRWSMQMGLIEANPVIGSAAPKAPPPRERVLSPDEIAAVWRACGDDDFGCIVRLLILLGQRRSEIGGMRWSSELDLDKAEWRLPSERVKTHRAHLVPLSPMAVAILRSIPRQDDRDLVFGGSDRGFVNWSRAKADLDRRLGDSVKSWRLHDLRRSVATHMADAGVAPWVIEQALNHQGGHKGGLAGVYNHSRYEREVAIALTQWADYVRVLVEGGARKIVPMPRRARAEAEAS